MTHHNTPQLADKRSPLLRALASKLPKMGEWIAAEESQIELPLYSSVDIRYAGYKAAVVDTNLFPAGFNNLCLTDMRQAGQLLRKALLQRLPGVERVCIICEEHTRNVWYLENVYQLKALMQAAGLDVIVATICMSEDEDQIDVITASQKQMRIYCIRRVLREAASGQRPLDVIVLNHDLTGGIPTELRDTTVPIFPSIHAGWHSRSKFEHFSYLHAIVKRLGEAVGMDPWLLDTAFTEVEQVDINQDTDRDRLAQAAVALLAQISEKHAQHGVVEKPFLFLKSDSGTYGMGVMAIEDPQQIVDLNRKGRNKLYKGKNAVINSRFVLQEGVPSVHLLNGATAEVCMYQIANQQVGGFFRVHSQKSARESLNSPGATFVPICKDCPTTRKAVDQAPFFGVRLDPTLFELYAAMARLAGLAAAYEIRDLIAHKSGMTMSASTGKDEPQ